MARIELKNGAVFGSPVVSVFLTTSPANSLTDDELIACASEHFARWFGDIPWWVGVSRGKTVSRNAAGADNIAVVLQKASKVYWHITDPMHVFYDQDGTVDKNAIELAISSAKSRCMVPVVPVKSAPVQLLKNPITKPTVLDPKPVLESQEDLAVGSVESKSIVNISVEDATVRSYANTKNTQESSKKAKKKFNTADLGVAAFVAFLAEL